MLEKGKELFEEKRQKRLPTSVTLSCYTELSHWAQSKCCRSAAPNNDYKIWSMEYGLGVSKL